MLSLYIIIGIFTGIIFWIMYFKIANEFKDYSKLFVIATYVFSRVMIFLLLNDRSLWFIAKVMFECVLILLYFILINKKNIHIFEGTIAIMYTMNPFVLIALLDKSFYRVLLYILIATVAIALIELFSVNINNQLFCRLYIVYILFSGAMYFYCVSVDILGQSVGMCKQGDNNVPTLLILSLAGITASGLWFIYLLVKNRKNNLNLNDKSEGNCYVEKVKPLKYNILGKKDFIWMLILSIISAVIIFWNIGSHCAPESSMKLSNQDDSTKEIVLNFDKYYEVADINIFLGYESKRDITISYYDENLKKWNLIYDEAEVKSAFCWNKIDVNKKVKYLGIVLKNDDAVFNEIVIRDSQGNVILPNNSQKYKELFDEQNLFPKYTTYFTGTMFDEVYHGRTAFEILHGLKIYEVSHPPLGKCIISIGIYLFGMNPFGWRFMCAVFGIMLVPLIYAFAHKLFGKTVYSLCAALLVLFDFMHFTLSRIATIDIIVAFFIVLMFNLMICYICEEQHYIETNDKKYLLKSRIYIVLCGISTGLAIATKWTGIYAAMGIAIIFFIFIINTYLVNGSIKENKRHLLCLLALCVVSFIVIPAVIYVLSYISYLNQSDMGLLETVFSNNKYMLKYHENVTASHPYSSKWYEWMWLKVPLLDAYCKTKGNCVSIVCTFGNPAIWFGGIVSVFHNIYLWRYKKHNCAEYLVIAYFAMLVPWMFISRTVFIYQYFCCSLISVLLIINSFVNLKHKNNKIICILFVVMSGILFVFFYPIISGYSMPITYLHKALKWMDTWKFL